MEKEVPEAERRVKIKRTFSEKITLLVKQDIDDKELYGVIRQFFVDFLKLEYEFTYEELSLELNKIFIKQGLKKRIDKLLDDLSWFEYMPDHELSQEEKKKILNDFKDMISQLILDLEEKPGKASFLDKLFGKKKGESVVQTQEISGISVQTLPDLDIIDVQQKNLEMKKELQKEMIARKEPENLFSNMINNINESNNLLLATDNMTDDASDKKISIDAKPAKAIVGDKKPKTNPKNVQAPKDMPESFVMPESFPKSLIDLPLLSLEDNDPGLVAIKALIEQSYNSFYSGDIESAKAKYMDALVVYNRFDYDKKTKTYLQLYEIYNRLTI